MQMLRALADGEKNGTFSYSHNGAYRNMLAGHFVREKCQVKTATAADGTNSVPAGCRPINGPFKERPVQLTQNHSDWVLF